MLLYILTDNSDHKVYPFKLSSNVLEYVTFLLRVVHNNTLSNIIFGEGILDFGMLALVGFVLGFIAGLATRGGFRQALIYGVVGAIVVPVVIYIIVAIVIPLVLLLLALLVIGAILYIILRGNILW